MGKIFANHISDKGLVSKIYPELIQLNSKTSHNPSKNKGRHTDGQQVHENMLNIINHRAMQVKTTMRSHFTHIRVAIIKKTRDMRSFCDGTGLVASGTVPLSFGSGDLNGLKVIGKGPCSMEILLF